MNNGNFAPTDQPDQSIGRRYLNIVTAGLAAAAVLLPGCALGGGTENNETERAGDGIKPQIPTEPVTRLEGIAFGHLSESSRVENGEFKDISLARVADHVRDLQERYKEGCTWELAPSFTVPVYTDVDGVPHELRMDYTPGDNHIKSFLGILPPQVSVTNGFYGFFNGERTDFKAKVSIVNKKQDPHQLRSTLYLAIPEGISIPPPVQPLTDEELALGRARQGEPPFPVEC